MTATLPVAPVVESTPGHTPNLNAALVAARMEFGPLHKNATNAFLKKQDGSPHRFADLSAILDLIEDTLLKHGVVVMQHPGGTATMAEVTTELRHVSGEMTSSTARCPATKQDPQGYGAAFTYLRRFALEGIMGLRAEDDDGNSLVKKPAPHPQSKPPRPPPPKVDARGETPAKTNEREVALTTGMPTKNWSELGEPLTDRARLEVKMTECQTAEELTMVASGIAPIAEAGKLTPAETKELRSIYAQRMNALLIAAKK